jgi:hypothetical protein
MRSTKKMLSSDSNKLSFNSRFLGPLAFLLAFGILGSTFVFVSHAAPGGKKTPPPTTTAGPSLSLTPAKQTIAVGTNLQVQVWLDTKDIQVNTVQAVLQYPTDKLAFVSSEGAGSHFDIEAENTNAGGKVTMARGSVTPLMGKQLVGMVTFKAIKARSTASLQFDPTSQSLATSDQRNVLANLVGGQYSITK